MRHRRERGSALVLALIAAGLCAYLSLFIIQAHRSDATAFQGQLERVRLNAAADAGLMMAIHGLGLDNPGDRWPLDGKPRQLRFDGAVLTVTVEDERGKVALDIASDSVMRRLLAGAGLQGGQLDSLSDAILDWIDQDEIPRRFGAEAAEYKAAGADFSPRNGKIRTMDELLCVRGMTPEILDRIAPALTLYFGGPGTFNEKHATPLAVMAIKGKTEDPLEMQMLQSMISDGSMLSLEPDAAVSMPGRSVTVRVTAEFPDGGRVAHATIVQFTGNRAQPFWIRSYL